MRNAQRRQIGTVFMIGVYHTASHAIPSLTMSTKPSQRKLQSIREIFKRRASSPGQPTSSSEPPNSSPGVSTFGSFIDGVDAPQTVAETVYNGSKILLDVIDKVGYAVPPLKAAAAGIGRIMTVVDVCNSRRLAIAMRTKHTPASQNVVQNKKDYESIAQKLESIITIAQKYQQHGCQRALDRRIEDLSTYVVSSWSSPELTSASVLSNIIPKRSNVYKSAG